MATIDEDLHNILNGLVAPFGIANTSRVQEAQEKIKALILKNLPKDKPNKHKGIVQEGTSEYAYLNGMRDGYNQCLSEIRKMYE